MKQLNFYGFNINSSSFYKTKKITTNNAESFYYASNDIISNIHSNTEPEKKYTFLGIANTHMLHCIANCLEKGYDIKRIIAVDYSKLQVEHVYNTILLIKQSLNRIDFIEKFYKIKINERARNILNSFPKGDIGVTRGGIEKEHCPYKTLEEQFWMSVQFQNNPKTDKLTRNWELTKNGIATNEKTIGDINKKYLTIYSCNKPDYDAWPFTIGWNSGFLRSDNTFFAMQILLRSIEIYIIQEDISHVIEPILLSNRYESIIFWSSNIFDDYFLKKKEKLKETLNKIQKLSSQKELPEINLYHIHDQRIRNLKPIRFRKKQSVHTMSFSKVIDFMADSYRCLELTNMDSWITEDHNISKLPNTDYMNVHDFLSSNNLNNARIDCIFFHILMGHGVSQDTFKKAFQKAKSLNMKIVILEHNMLSRDFLNSNNVTTDLSTIRAICGKEKRYSFCPGFKDQYRNIILEF